MGAEPVRKAGMRVGLVVHPERPEAAELAARLRHWLTAGGHIPVDLDVTGAFVVEPPDQRLDVAVSLGGDGTMLRTVELVAPHGVPVLGVNFGQLGYLTQVEPSATTAALEAVFAGDYHLEERMLLRIRVERVGSASTGEAGDGHWLLALNEAVLEKTLSGHTVRLAVAIDGVPFTPYAADGLIVSTPTGSTAYAFSARGPIIAPTHRALLLTPVSPHMLFDRSLILEPSTELTITVEGRRAALTVDGRRVGDLDDGDRVRCTAAPVDARLVTFKPRNFHQILKRKFGLSDR